MSAGLAAAAAVVWLFVPTIGRAIPLGSVAAASAVVALLEWSAYRASAYLDVGETRVAVCFNAASLAAALLVLPPGLAVCALLGGQVVASRSLLRRPHLLAANVAMCLLGTGWATLLHGVSRSAIESSGGVMVGVLAGVSVASVTSTFVVGLLGIRLMGGKPDVRTTTIAGALHLVLSIIVAVLVAGGVYLARRSPWWLLGPAGILGFAALLAQRYAVVEQRYQRTKGLYQFSALLERTIDVGQEKAASVLVELTTLLNARRVDLVLQTHNHLNEIVRLTSDGDGSVSLELSLLEEQLLSGPAGKPQLLLATHGPDSTAELARYDARQLIHVPLGQEGYAVGVLTVIDRPGYGHNFGAADLALCEALAQHMGLWLTRARLAERLHRELEMREHQAHHDDLTGLPNRRQLGRLLPDVIGAAAERLEHVGLVLIDLDRFKDVNDTLGHAAGDRLLIDVATRLAHLLPLGSLVARLGGDEFAVILPPAGSADGAMALCEQVANAFVDRFSVDGVELLVEASMGVVIAPGDGADLDTLLRRADVAMYEGKRGHVRLVRYDPALDPHSPDQLSVTAALQRGIETGELLMHFQPKIDIATGMVAGVEALVRWNRGGAELVPPDKFISQAEHSGLAGPLFTEVLNLSLAQARKWHNEGLVLGVAVNMSARNLADPDLAVVVGEALSRFRLPPGLVTLELTENAALANPVLAQQALARLLSLGVRIALDDFGTGHSSIRLLRDFPIQELKIDRSFVGAMHHDADAYAIVGNLTRLARDLRLGVVAEGVEDLVTHQALVDLGCDSAQGWYYARAADGESITAWLRDRTITDLHHRQHGPTLGCFYDLLAVPLRASLDEIDAAYSQSMRSAVTAGNLSLVARLRVAYETLTDSTLRASYDRTLVRRSKVA